MGDAKSASPMDFRPPKNLHSGRGGGVEYHYILRMSVIVPGMNSPGRPERKKEISQERRALT